jgi:predicted transcriptional regulator
MDIDWDKYGYVKSSEYRQTILLELDEFPLTPTDLRDKTEFNRSHVSSVLQDLVQKGLVECLNPDAKKGRVYGLTEEGEQIVDALRSSSE